ncbi:DUF2806 domain-containing protein [Vibrio cholerae]|uniref:DUF2806 domain-containing protein n=1 Tax=Vibrio cholerae TaxID=666 RepID=UPI000BA8F2D0|nr:DUF2806 domain-containing protein [Vibrio cholerae]EGR0190148.1 DUF2806 domain-containing protein [Vibrio cholerae]EGR1403030.1 DUF2806 domain-containing protein [Vibrio cholerae]EGR1429638.1 DUF2806 domain-containing protein [Vibrio cholerae]EIR1601450.1 DUF2806 domain-containing protein [Vibrio cholerae]EJL6575617.1 DUF2806 domain-containing protein [Vibrio cholerae]
MSDGNSVINFGDLAKPATVLIEKVSNAIGVLYEPRRIRKKAEAEVEAEKIKVLAGIELNEIQQRGIERFVQQEARKQANIEAITAQAASQLDESAKTDNLEEDWIAHFFDKCDKVSDAEMQTLWSSLLAGEAQNPGTYSKRTVDFVATMDKKDAELFTNFCQFVWMVGSATPLIFDFENEIYTKNGINFASLKHLDAIGLISFESLSGYRRFGLPKKAVFFYYGQPTLVEFENDNNNEVQIGKVLFTKAGLELINICGAKRSQEFYEYSVSELSKQGLILSSLLA